MLAKLQNLLAFIANMNIVWIGPSTPELETLK